MNIKFRELPESDLIPGNIYEGGRRDVDGVTGKGRDVLAKLLGVDNAGGFRKKKIDGNDDGYAFVALALRGNDPLWPNEFDETTGLLKYYGDNKIGTNFLTTGKKGNLILKEVFDKLNYFNILDIPPFFAFQNINDGEDLKFLGLAVPGHPDICSYDALELYQGETNDGDKFLNYKAFFTILDTGEEPISREWLKRLVEDNENSLQYAPTAWKDFIEKGLEGIKPLEVIHDYKNRDEKDGCNKLYYGVPGSGKSHQINRDLKDIPELQKERILFHPDYTYSDFIGQILPKTENGDISYIFTPGPFTRILEKAFHNPNESYYLIIEEINRGNAPAIFGDVFQLLDRIKETSEERKECRGTSEFSITNIDIAKYIYNTRELEKYGYKVRIPSNLSIYATMNTSDQNVFTLDTAFQRRWDMEMIKNNWDDEKVKFKIKGTNMDWSVFGKGMNELIIKENKHGLSSEDKRLGAYFIKKEDFDENMNDSETKKLFAEKVLKYLWDDAFKFGRRHVFEEEEGQPFTLEFFIDKFTDDETEDSFSIFTKEARSYIGLKDKTNQGLDDAE